DVYSYHSPPVPRPTTTLFRSSRVPRVSPRRGVGLGAGLRELLPTLVREVSDAWRRYGPCTTASRSHAGARAFAEDRRHRALALRSEEHTYELRSRVGLVCRLC